MQQRSSAFLVALLAVGYMAAGAVANLISAESRAVGALGLITLLSMIVSALAATRPRRMVAATFGATVLAMFAIYAWRRWFNESAVVGAVPRSLEPIALVVLGVINIAAAAIVAHVFAAARPVSRFRWMAFGAIVMALLVFCATAAWRAGQANSPQALLRSVVMLERSSARDDWTGRQQLSTTLAFLGRQREAREIPPSPDAAGDTLADLPDPPASDPPYRVTPWREAIARIAAERRLVLIMEAHTVSEHRAWIEQTLGLFRTAGFTHYFAEAISESGSTLKSRGYPTRSTGFYTLDPRFGNLLRTAISLDFELSGYDSSDHDFERREAHQAAALAKAFASRPNLRMMVHAGHGHIFKYEVRNVGRYMAARLWEMTGVEPFTVWQLSNALPNDVYRRLIHQIGPIHEPVMLMPPPRDVAEALFPESTVQPAVDAIVIHPPRLGREPTDRRGAFSDQMTRVQGVWRGDEWPVVVAAMVRGEPDNAVPLDQVMLRPGETDFELWVPRTDYTIRVWGLNGPLNADRH